MLQHVKMIITMLFTVLCGLAAATNLAPTSLSHVTINSATSCISGQRSNADTTLYSILTRMNVVTANLVAVNETVDQLKASSLLSLPIALKIASLQRQINHNTGVVIATLDAVEAPLSRADSERLIYESAFHDWLIISFLENVVRHKTGFQSAVLYAGDLSRSLHRGLKDGKERVGLFAQAARRVIQPGMEISAKEMLDSWDDAIGAFEHCSGRICLPDMNSYRKYVGL